MRVKPSTVVCELSGIRRELFHYEKSDTPGGYIKVDDGYEEGTIELSVDLETIGKWLGRKAMGNKSGVSKEIDGAVVVKVLRRERKEG